MNIEQVKNIALEDYLHSLGFSPIKQQGSSLWYNSPFRTETEASFKVNLTRNEWYDFGLGKGGNIIALASELHGTDSVPYLLQRIAEQTSVIHPVSFSFRPQPSLPSFQQLEVEPLNSPILLAYLQERGVNTELAKKECRELHFVNNGKWYFAIGFPNVVGGYEVRNKYFKGCISPKDITHIKQGRETCIVFEGFIDYLSFLTLRQKSCPASPDLDKQDYLILNSVTNLPKAWDVLEIYQHIICLLDNDKAGCRATEEIRQRCGYKVFDQSDHYRGYKDLNDRLCGKKQEQTPKVKHSAEPATGKEVDSEAKQALKPKETAMRKSIQPKKPGRRMKF
ncbi:toprim domain-containing protein [Bacteroides neonati]|uniref:toprim domain-containing protein n=1 Tax=Bacteroides neonati TaxID=1347393 RepID=UPI0004B60365|nr:toprim domain-containing protein [Bacteroides neonati]